MSGPGVPPDERFQALVGALRDEPKVSVGSGRRVFGASALQVDGRIFAMLSQGRLVVKLPRSRVGALVAAGTGDRFDPRRDGRLMREWLSVDPSSDADWLTLAREALAFGSKPTQ